MRIINYQPHKYAIVVTCGEGVIKAKTGCDDNYVVTCVVLDGKIVLLISL
jgi:hypothetical protein